MTQDIILEPHPKTLCAYRDLHDNIDDPSVDWLALSTSLSSSLSQVSPSPNEYWAIAIIFEGDFVERPLGSKVENCKYTVIGLRRNQIFMSLNWMVDKLMTSDDCPFWGRFVNSLYSLSNEDIAVSKVPPPFQLGEGEWYISDRMIGLTLRSLAKAAKSQNWKTNFDLSEYCDTNNYRLKLPMSLFLGCEIGVFAGNEGECHEEWLNANLNMARLEGLR